MTPATRAIGTATITATHDSVVGSTTADRPSSAPDQPARVLRRGLRVQPVDRAGPTVSGERRPV
jgi:hypothetical protein